MKKETKEEKIKKAKNRFLCSLLSENTEVHVLSRHFVSEETAEMRARMEDTTSSTFLGISWKSVKRSLVNWVQSDASNSWFERNVLSVTEEWTNRSILFDPKKGAIGVLYPNCGAKQDCFHFVVKVIVHKYTDYYGKEKLDVRVKTIHPVK